MSPENPTHTPPTHLTEPHKKNFLYCPKCHFTAAPDYAALEIYYKGLMNKYFPDILEW